MSEFDDKLKLFVQNMEAALPLLDWLEANKTELQGLVDGTHKIRPIKPTQKMIDAGETALENAQDSGCSSSADGERYEYTYFINGTSGAALAVFQAMIDASE